MLRTESLAYLWAADPQNERIWKEPSDADESRLLVSREYVDGSVEWRLCRMRALIGE